MFLFIAASLALCYLVQTASPLLNSLDSEIAVYAGGLALGCMAGIIFHKRRAKIWCDVFACSTLIAWFAGWRPFFNEDSPIFFYFPVYFVFTAVFVELFFTDQHHKMDTATRQRMESMVKHVIAQPWMIMLGVLASLALQQHYLLYPVAMTLLLMRISIYTT
ncbi:MAG: hypothetical protein Q7U57_03950 [Methylovulum sp.]|nr:hypothetical protein [Methylovulum sp.]